MKKKKIFKTSVLMVILSLMLSLVAPYISFVHAAELGASADASIEGEEKTEMQEADLTGDAEALEEDGIEEAMAGDAVSVDDLALGEEEEATEASPGDADAEEDASEETISEDDDTLSDGTTYAGGISPNAGFVVTLGPNAAEVAEETAAANDTSEYDAFMKQFGDAEEYDPDNQDAPDAGKPDVTDADTEETNDNVQSEQDEAKEDEIGIAESVALDNLGATYKTVKGNNEVWDKSSTDGLEFEFSSADGDAYNNFSELTINSNPVKSSYYTKDMGGNSDSVNLKIILNPDYLTTLSVGTHKLEVSFKSDTAGQYDVVKATFRIKGSSESTTAESPEEAIKKNETTTESNTSESSGNSKGGNISGDVSNNNSNAASGTDKATTGDASGKKTGDSNNIMFAIVMMIISFGGMVLTVLEIKLKR